MTKDKPQFYSLRDLEEETGFDARTIYFYVQEGLLPKLGRRGRMSLYPQAFLDRLLFIKKLKALQDAGKIAPITLRDIGRVLNRLPPETVARVASGDESLDAVAIDAYPSEYGGAWLPDLKTTGEGSRELKQQVFGSSPEEAAWGGEEEPPERPESSITRGPTAAFPGKRVSEEHEWTTMSVTDDIMLTVRGKNAGSLPLVKKIVAMIRALVKRGG